MASLFFLPFSRTYAEPPENVQKQIDKKNAEIKKLEAEAQKYRTTIDTLDQTANTLQTRIKVVDNTVKRLDANIRITDAKIVRTNLEIKELSRDIAVKADSIARARDRLIHLVTGVAAADQETPLEILMKNETLSSFFDAVDQVVSIQASIHDLLADLREARQELSDRKTKAEQKKLELAALVSDLHDQKALQEQERKERANLLAETKNQEKKYQQLLADVERRRDALQQEIDVVQSGLATKFDLSVLPKAGTGVLGWPLPDPIFVTQYFGLTSFARAGGYNGKGHNGIDFRAAVGTPVFSSERGVIRAVGDTDAACRRASYGRWILIDHPNHLSTLYAHLSLIKVSVGDAVNRGELVAYSGQTGYATGPHLHLSVFASEAVSIEQIKSRVCGRTMTLPVAPFGGYLNPTNYL